MKKTREQKIRRRFCREFAGDLYFYCLLLTGSAEEAQGIARAVLGAEHTGLTLLEIKKSLYLMALESCREAVRSREEDALLPDSGPGASLVLLGAAVPASQRGCCGGVCRSVCERACGGGG